VNFGGTACLHGFGAACLHGSGAACLHGSGAACLHGSGAACLHGSGAVSTTMIIIHVLGVSLLFHDLGIIRGRCRYRSSEILECTGSVSNSMQVQSLILGTVWSLREGFR
jgi:hypothetical protein